MENNNEIRSNNEFTYTLPPFGTAKVGSELNDLKGAVGTEPEVEQPVPTIHIDPELENIMLMEEDMPSNEGIGIPSDIKGKWLKLAGIEATPELLEKSQEKISDVALIEAIELIEFLNPLVLTSSRKTSFSSKIENLKEWYDANWGVIVTSRNKERNLELLKGIHGLSV